MMFTALRGRAFKEEFAFKNAAGKDVAVPNGQYVLYLEHGNTVHEFANLKTGRSKVFWTMTADETKSLEFDTMYFTLLFNDTEIARGVLRVK